MKRGFTLAELLALIAIIGIMVSVGAAVSSDKKADKKVISKDEQIVQLKAEIETLKRRLISDGESKGYPIKDDCQGYPDESPQQECLASCQRIPNAEAKSQCLNSCSDVQNLSPRQQCLRN